MVWHCRAILSPACRRHARAGWHALRRGTDIAASVPPSARRSPKHPYRRPAVATCRSSLPWPWGSASRAGAAKVRQGPPPRSRGEPPIGRYLAAINRQQRRATGRIEFEHVIAGRSFRLAGAVVIERPHAGIGPDDVRRQHRLFQVFAGRRTEILNLLRAGFHLGRIAVVVAIGGADQRKVVLIGNDEDDAAIGVLEHVG